MKEAYLDNSATTQTCPEAVEKIVELLTVRYGNPSSLHKKGIEAEKEIRLARQIIADYLGCDISEIYFTSGGSESDNWAIETACKFGKLTGKNQIITSAFEHHAILHTLEEKQKQGFEIVYLPVYENGIIHLEDLKNAITNKTCLVTIMFANNEIGTIQPISEIGALCREKQIIFHTDAVQAVGHLPIDVKKMNIDMLSMSGHKFHGPKGVGALYCKKGTPLFSFIHGGAQERNRRAGTENLPGVVGMSVALDLACKEMAETASHEIKLRNKLFEELSKIPHSKINGDLVNRLPNNFNMSFEGVEGESLLLLLDDKGICASSGSACTSGSLDPSHVLLAIGLPHEIAHGSLRLTLSKFSTGQEIDETIKAVPKIVEYLRTISPVWDKLKKGEIKHVI